MSASPERGWRASPPGPALVYALVTLPMFAAWELAHAPLYTIWVDAGPAAAWRAALHCTVGDAAIAFGCALAADLLGCSLPWLRRAWRREVLAVALGLLITVFIEWISTRWLGRWAYRESMPVVPLLGVGLSPLLQWLVVPLTGIWILRRRRSRAD